MIEQKMRLGDLLFDRATEGLDANEELELGRLLAAHPDTDEDAYELAAAAVELAVVASRQEDADDEPLPAALRQKIIDQSARFVDTAAPASQTEAAAARTATPVDLTARRARRSSSRWPWLAVAASLALAVVGWWPRQPEVVLGPAAPLDAGSRRTQLLATEETLSLDWSATEDPAAAGASGDVVWSNDRQTGFMRFADLPINDPSQSTYQLWIFDGERDDRYPIDGGVFDITSPEQIVPIDARLPVSKPTLFAITVEPPGGVVVSSRERIVLVAAVG